MDTTFTQVLGVDISFSSGESCAYEFSFDTTAYPISGALEFEILDLYRGTIYLLQGPLVESSTLVAEVKKEGNKF